MPEALAATQGKKRHRQRYKPAHGNKRKGKKPGKRQRVASVTANGS